VVRYNRLWNIIILDDTLSESTVRGWLAAASIPSCFQFTFDNTFKDAWILTNTYGASVPAPIAPWTIMISAARDPRFSWSTIGGVAFFGSRNCTVRYDSLQPTDTPAELGARIWHEMSHVLFLPADGMGTSEFSEFVDYLGAMGSPYADYSSNPAKYGGFGAAHTGLLIEYYTYLTYKYLGCECYNEGCGQDLPVEPPVEPPYVPPVVEPPAETPYVEPPYVPPVVYEDTGDDHTKQLIILAFGIGLVLLLTN
jgi:hypothetical protein